MMMFDSNKTRASSNDLSSRRSNGEDSEKISQRPSRSGQPNAREENIEIGSAGSGTVQDNRWQFAGPLLNVHPLTRELAENLRGKFPPGLPLISGESTQLGGDLAPLKNQHENKFGPCSQTGSPRAVKELYPLTDTSGWGEHERSVGEASEHHRRDLDSVKDNEDVQFDYFYYKKRAITLQTRLVECELENKELKERISILHHENSEAHHEVQRLKEQLSLSPSFDESKNLKLIMRGLEVTNSDLEARVERFGKENSKLSNLLNATVQEFSDRIKHQDQIIQKTENENQILKTKLQNSSSSSSSSPLQTVFENRPVGKKEVSEVDSEIKNRILNLERIVKDDKRILDRVTSETDNLKMNTTKKGVHLQDQINYLQNQIDDIKKLTGLPSGKMRVDSRTGPVRSSSSSRLVASWSRAPRENEEVRSSRTAPPKKVDSNKLADDESESGSDGSSSGSGAARRRRRRPRTRNKRRLSLRGV